MPKMTTKKANDKIEEEKTISNQNIDMQEVLSLLQSIKQENELLKQDLDSIKNNKENKANGNTSTSQDTLIEALTRSLTNVNNASKRDAENLRSNREVTIVHNAELLGGLATVLSLASTEIVFHRLGEERTVSWEQFEELCGKYRGFIANGTIMVSPKYEHLCDAYKIQCFTNSIKKIKLTSSLLAKVPDMTETELSETFNGLNKIDQKVLLNYWLGECYARPEDRDERFYDRYKLELLNHLSESGIFNNILTDMNNQ